MSSDIPEGDWKIFREVHAAARQRYCQNVLSEAKSIVGARSKTPHERYLNLYVLMMKRDRKLARTFSQFSRSSAIAQLTIYHCMGLVTPEELHRFSPETLRRVAMSAPIPPLEPAPPPRPS